MIKHKELVRGDDEALKAEAKRTSGSEKHADEVLGSSNETGRTLGEDLEMGQVDVKKM